MSLPGSLRVKTVSAAVLAAALLAVAGCGETVVDLSKTEDQIQAEVEKRSPGATVSAVECPSGVEVEAGRKFTCTVRLSGGETETATLRIRDEEANLTLLGFQSDK